MIIYIYYNNCLDYYIFTEITLPYYTLGLLYFGLFYGAIQIVT